MQFKLFTIPVCSSALIESDLNKFLRSHRVMTVERHFCPDSGGYWTFLVEYMDSESIGAVTPSNRKERKDPTENMDSDTQARYDRLRDIRRTLANERDVPAYVIFTNEELAQLAKLPEPLTAENAKQVKGIAPSRFKEYISYFYTAASDDETM